jgi:hypothetical protein
MSEGRPSYAALLDRHGFVPSADTSSPDTQEVGPCAPHVPHTCSVSAGEAENHSPIRCSFLNCSCSSRSRCKLPCSIACRNRSPDVPFWRLFTRLRTSLDLPILKCRPEYLRAPGAGPGHVFGHAQDVVNAFGSSLRNIINALKPESGRF